MSTTTEAPCRIHGIRRCTICIVSGDTQAAYCLKCGAPHSASARCGREAAPAPADQEQWLAMGRARGWAGPIVCVEHDGTPTTADEDARYEAGEDPCVPMVRLYADAAERKAVEANHSPSVWRR